jgi:hypothetical protein
VLCWWIAAVVDTDPTACTRVVLVVLMVLLQACSFAESNGDDPVRWLDGGIDVSITLALLVVLVPRGWWRDVLLLPLLADLVYHVLEPAFQRLFEHNRRRRLRRQPKQQ